MIREAEEKDIPRILEMGREYYKRMEFEEASGVSLEEESLQKFVRHLIKLPQGTVLVCEEEGNVVAGIAGSLYPWVGNRNFMGAQEHAVYGDRSEELRKAFDAWALSRGAIASIISCYVTQEGPRIRRNYGN